MKFVKIYRYRVQPGLVERFLRIQAEADAIYKRHVSYRLEHFRSTKSPWDWVEVHQYASRDAAHAAEGLSDKEPELKRLFREFVEVLDPNDPKIEEELYEDRSVVR